MILTHPFLFGIVAGLGIAVPLGAIGVLVVLDGIDRGIRSALGSAAGVATVDAVYCAVAVVFGATAAPVISGLGSLPRIVGGVALIALAAWNTARLRRRAIGTANVRDQSRAGGPLTRFAVFVGLTAINPATLLYFAALVIPMADAMTASASTRFVLGVGAGSLGWQMVLAVGGALAGTQITDAGRRITVIIGNLIVGGFGLVMIVSTAL